MRERFPQKNSRHWCLKVSHLAAIICFWLAPHHSLAAMTCSEVFVASPVAGQVQNASWLEKRLAPDERAYIYNISREDLQQLDHFANALKRADWSDSLLDLDQISADRHMKIAFHAYKKGLISLAQFTSLNMKWAAIDSLAGGRASAAKKVEIVGVDGKITPSGRALLTRLAPRPTDAALYLPRTLRPGMTNAELDNFARKLSRQPRSEQFFWILPYPETEHLYQTLPMAQDIRFSPFFLYPKDSVDSLEVAKDQFLDRITRTPNASIVQSFSAIQIYLDVVYGKNAIQLIPELGATTQSEMFDGVIKGGRVFGLSFPNLNSNTVADYFEAGKYYFSIHDWGHASTGSRFPLFYRQILARLGMVILSLSDKTPTNNLEITNLLAKKMNLNFSAHEIDSVATYLDSMNYASYQVNLTNLFTEIPKDLQIVDGRNISSVRMMTLLLIDMQVNPQVYNAFGIHLKDYETSLDENMKRILQKIRVQLGSS